MRLDEQPEGTIRYTLEAQEQGFEQCVRTLANTFLAIPIAWVVIGALVYQKVPFLNFLLWVVIFFIVWLLSVFRLRRLVKESISSKKNELEISIIVAMEGLLWGGMFYVLLGHDPELDSWVAIFLIGFVSIALPSYISYPKAFNILLGSIWIGATVAVLFIGGRYEYAHKTIVVLAIYLIALACIIRPIAVRVQEGIRLNLENQALTQQLHLNLEAAILQADTDALTGQLNRRALNRILNRLIKEADRRRNVFSLLMIDIDFFKSINDKYGHDVGDKALQHVAKLIAGQLRSEDACARFGGEEFIVVLDRADAKQALVIAERIRHAVQESPLKSPQHYMTLSIGVATYSLGMSLEALLKEADNQVYKAKANGRNQVCITALD